MSSAELQTPKTKHIGGHQFHQNYYFDGPQTMSVNVHNHPEDGDYPKKTWRHGTESMQSRTQLRINKPLPIQLIYTSLLLSKGEGYALWHPQPNESCQDGIQIGDVGVLHNQISFECLFNIQNSNSSITAGGSDLEGSNPRKNIGQRPLRNWSAYTAHVEKNGGECWEGTSKGTMEDDPLNMKSPCTFNFRGSHYGAILMLPEGSWRDTATFATSQLFQKRAIIQAKQWFQDAEKKLHKPMGGRDFLYLVTGYDKTFSWGISAFVNESGNPISLTFLTHDTGDKHNKYSWKPEYRSLGPGCRCHPDASDCYSESPSSTPLERVPNQCVFVRGYIITRRPPEDVKVTDIVSEDCSGLLFWPEDSSPDVAEPAKPSEPRITPVIYNTHHGDITYTTDSFNAKHTNNYDSYNQSHRSVDRRQTLQGDMQGSLPFEREGSHGQATEGSSSSADMSPSQEHQPPTPLSIDYFQQSILVRVSEQYHTPFKPEPAMRDMLAKVLGLEPSVVDQWFLNRRVTSKSWKNKISTSRLEKSGQAALLEILMGAWAASHRSCPSEDEAQSICRAANVSPEVFEDWKNCQQPKSVAQVPRARVNWQERTSSRSKSDNRTGHSWLTRLFR